MRRSIVFLFAALVFISNPFSGQPIVQEFPDKIINNKDGSEMIKIPAGSFLYGIYPWVLKKMKRPANLTNDFFSTPQSKETLPDFYIDRFEITNKQFAKFLAESKYLPPASWKTEKASKNPNLPVTEIGWKDAMAYAKWAGKRLPSELEWEKASRGEKGKFWPWGGYKDDPSKYNGVREGLYTAAAVGSHPEGKSDYGVEDMAGNVYEMTSGRWVDGSPCMRGGSFLNQNFYVMTVFRWSPKDTVNGANWLGFRCVMDAANAAKFKK